VSELVNKKLEYVVDLVKSKKLVIRWSPTFWYSAL